MDQESILILVGSIVDILAYFGLSVVYIGVLSESRKFSPFAAEVSNVDAFFVAFLVLESLGKVFSNLVGILGVQNNASLRTEYAPTFVADTVEAVLTFLTLGLAGSSILRGWSKPAAPGSAALRPTFAGVVRTPVFCFTSLAVIIVLWVVLGATTLYQSSASNTIYASLSMVVATVALLFPAINRCTTKKPLTMVRFVFYLFILLSNTLLCVGNAMTLVDADVSSYDEDVWIIRLVKTSVAVILALTILSVAPPQELRRS